MEAALDLAGISPLLKELARRGVLRRYARGRLLIDEGDTGDTLFIVLEGRLRAFATADNGRAITYGHYGPGEYVGEMSLDGGPRSASVEVLTPCTCSVVTRSTLESFVRERPEFAFELLAKVIRRARAATASARQMALNSVYGRLRHLLESLARPHTDGTRCIDERLTHKDIAARIGCSREMVSRLVKDLEKGGYLRVADDRLILVQHIPPGW